MNQPPTWLRFSAWCAVLVWAATIYWFSSRTGPEIQRMNIFELWDKAAHFLAFASGAVPLALALRWSCGWSWGKVVLTAALVIASYGALDEYHQTFTPNRSGNDVFDWTADTLGGLIGSLLTVFIYARISRPHREAPAGN